MTDGLDVLIVDTNSDLNIYVTAKDDGSGPCCDSKPETLSCCGSKSAGSEGTQGFVENIKAEFKGIDFNEWAGKSAIQLVCCCFMASQHGR